MKIGTAPEYGQSRFHLYCRLKSRCASELEAVLERGRLVEHEMFRSGILVLEEVTYALELHSDSAVVLKKGRLCISFRNYERIWVQIALVVLSLRNRAHLSLGEQFVIQTQLNFLGMLYRHPVDCTLY